MCGRCGKLVLRLRLVTLERLEGAASNGVFTLASIRPWSPKPLISSVVTVRTRMSFRKSTIFSSPLASRTATGSRHARGTPRTRDDNRAPCGERQRRPLASTTADNRETAPTARHVAGNDECCLAFGFFECRLEAGERSAISQPVGYHSHRRGYRRDVSADNHDVGRQFPSSAICRSRIRATLDDERAFVATAKASSPTARKNCRAPHCALILPRSRP